MKKALKALAWLLALGIILYGGWRGMRIVQERKAARQEVPPSDAESAPIEVAVKPVQRGSVSARVWVTGETRALQSVEIAPKVSGRLERLRLPDGTLVEEGVEVKEGQAVAIIEHNQFAAAVRSAEAALEVARAARETAKVNLADAQREKERWIELRKGGSGTQQQLDQAVTAYERAQAQLKQAEAQVAQSKAALAQAKVNLDDATIEAPFSGLVVRKRVDEGAYVGPGAPLFTLADISQVEITGGVAGRHYQKLHTGKTKAIVEVDAYPDETFEGAVTRLRPELDRVTRTVAVTIRVPNPEMKLKPGMYARIQLVLDERENVVIVPDEAIIASGGKTRVYVVNDATVHVREVKIGIEEGTKNEVLEGVRPGERVVVRGQQLLSEGMDVKPVEEEAIQ